LSTTPELLPRLLLEPESPARASIIWLHGLGADGHDFEPVAAELQPRLPVPVRFILPHAPILPITINQGQATPAWYDKLDLQHPRNIVWETFRNSATRIHDLIAEENRLGIPTEKILLAGFSQGGALAIETTLRYQIPIAGILALSTYYIGADPDQPTPKAPQPIPVFFGHGTTDLIIPLEVAEASRKTLESLGFQTTWKTYPMPHSVCLEELQDLAAWLVRILAPPA
jgi:phospholipase/carboxylesterase